MFVNTSMEMFPKILSKQVNTSQKFKGTLISSISVILKHIFMYLTHFIKDA